MDWNVLDAHEALQDERGHAVHGGPDQGVGSPAQCQRNRPGIRDVVEELTEQRVHDAGRVQGRGRDESVPAEGDAEQVRMRDGECDVGTGGRAQAFVQIGEQSGPLCPGPRGRCGGGAPDQPLLPPGWSVTGIDAANGLLAVSFGRQRQVIPLSP